MRRFKLPKNQHWLTSQELIAAYDALLAANIAQKRTEFDGASANIQKGFSKLGELQNLSVDSYAQLLDTLKRKSQSRCSCGLLDSGK